MNKLFKHTIWERIKWPILRRLFPSPVQARHMEYSMLYSEDDSIARPSERIIDISLFAINYARKTDLSDVCKRLQGRFNYPDDTINLWPGEHYRLLAAFMQVLLPKNVIEIGTGEGLSALSMLKYLPSDGKIYSFDIVPWFEYPRKCLNEQDFIDGRLEQIVEDLGNRDQFKRYEDLLCNADFFFIDAAKDGVLERRLIRNIETITFKTKPIFVFDDIRLWNMLAIWRELKWPKLDLTSFGHWCGTGVCEII